MLDFIDVPGKFFQKDVELGCYGELSIKAGCCRSILASKQPLRSKPAIELLVGRMSAAPPEAAERQICDASPSVHEGPADPTTAFTSCEMASGPADLNGERAGGGQLRAPRSRSAEDNKGVE